MAQSAPGQQEFLRLLLQDVRGGGAVCKPQPQQPVQQQQPQQQVQQQAAAPGMQLYGQQPQMDQYQMQMQQQQAPQQPAAAFNQYPSYAAANPQQQAGAARAARARPGKTFETCDVNRAMACLDPLVERAQSRHGDAAGRDGIVRGLQELYSKLRDGEFRGSKTDDDLAKMVAAMEVNDIATAKTIRDRLVRTTTTGWVAGGSWQWALKQVLAVA